MTTRLLLPWLLLFCSSCSTVSGETPAAPDRPPASPAKGPQTATLVQDGDNCQLSIRPVGGPALVHGKWTGQCGDDWRISTHGQAPEIAAVLTLGTTMVLVDKAGTRVLPAPPKGRLELAALSSTGNVHALTQEEAAGGKDTAMYSSVECRDWQLDGATWKEKNTATATSGEGWSGCAGTFEFAEDVRALYANTSRNRRGETGYRESAPLPPGSSLPDSPPGDDYSKWRFDGELSLLVRVADDIAGQRRQTPVMRWDGAKWAALPGLGSSGDPVDLYPRQGLLLICTHSYASIVDTASGEGRWSATGSCPVWWPLSEK